MKEPPFDNRSTLQAMDSIHYIIQNYNSFRDSIYGSEQFYIEKLNELLEAFRELDRSITGSFSGTGAVPVKTGTQPQTDNTPSAETLEEYKKALMSVGYTEEEAEYIAEHYPNLAGQIQGVVEGRVPDRYLENIKDDINKKMWEDSLCIYTPTYDIGDYVPVTKTNCYALAFGMTVNPLTGEPFPDGCLHAGELCGRLNEDGYDATNTDYMMELVEADAAAVGLDLQPIDSPSEAGEVGTLMALYYDPQNPGEYHWCVYNDEMGCWIQKDGEGYITNHPLVGSSFCGPDNPPLPRYGAAGNLYDNVNVTYNDKDTVPGAPVAGYTMLQLYYATPMMA